MFKALLFLCAGAVIHAVHSNEIKDMGGLRKYLPVTHITFLVACLAISGIPPFSGFFSKDEILVACFQFSPVMGITMTLIAGLTAFYMFRLYYYVFWSKEFGNSSENSQFSTLNSQFSIQEAPRSMTIPLIFLAAITCVAGFVPFGHFISSNGEAYSIHLNMPVAITSVCVAVLGIGIATWMYKTQHSTLKIQNSSLATLIFRRFYIDEIYQYITHRIIFACISAPLAWFDRHVVDGFMNSLAWATQTAGNGIRGFQSGRIQQYAMVFLGGILALIVILVLI
jgi:NADH-quinone oxidoreductase subunit L